MSKLEGYLEIKIPLPSFQSWANTQKGERIRYRVTQLAEPALEPSPLVPQATASPFFDTLYEGSRSLAQLGRIVVHWTDLLLDCLGKKLVRHLWREVC